MEANDLPEVAQPAGGRARAQTSQVLRLYPIFFFLPNRGHISELSNDQELPSCVELAHQATHVTLDKASDLTGFLLLSSQGCHSHTPALSRNLGQWKVSALY